MFKRAIALGQARENPARTARRAREDVSPLPLVSLAEQACLIAHIPADRRPLFLAALDTGARLGELLRLTWQDVALDRRTLLFRLTKSRRPRMVRMSRRLTQTLCDLSAARPPDAEGAAPVFEGATGRDGELAWGWRRSFKQAAAAIGQPDLRVHDCRHLAAINLVRAGVDLPTVQAHLGHRHLISTLRYAAYADETASARAAKALDQIHGDLDDPPDDL